MSLVLSGFDRTFVLLWLPVLATLGIQGCGSPVVSDKVSTTIQDERVDPKLIDPETAYRQGMRYGLGSDGIGRDETEAFRWLRQAAQQGHIKATYALAWLYLDGRGTPADPAEAARLFTTAAQRGDAESQYMLSLLHAQGRGVAKDSVTSLQWLQKAAASGHPEAKRILDNLFRPPGTGPLEKK